MWSLFGSLFYEVSSRLSVVFLIVSTLYQTTPDYSMHCPKEKNFSLKLFFQHPSIYLPPMHFYRFRVSKVHLPHHLNFTCRIEKFHTYVRKFHTLIAKSHLSHQKTSKGSLKVTLRCIFF